MGRPRAAFPMPGKRCRAGRWRVFWWAHGQSYELAIGDVDEQEAEARRLEVALALRRGEWPLWAQTAAAVRRYVVDRLDVEPNQALIGDFLRVAGAGASDQWMYSLRGYLREFARWVAKPLGQVTAADADGFLAHVLATPGPHRRRAKPRCVATRNKVLIHLRRFYRWGQRNGRLGLNPFDHCRRLRVADPAAGIIYCTRAERAALLAAADSIDDGVAVWLAFWTGMRRGEIARCAWADVRLRDGRVVVPVSKTRRRRVVPLAEPLAVRLRDVRQRTGRLTGWPAERGAWAYRATELLAAVAGRCPGVPRDRVRWNVWRHTFGSLLVQAGVGLDKVAAWMGNSPEVCRRHYAEFTPRDGRDVEIDRLI